MGSFWLGFEKKAAQDRLPGGKADFSEDDNYPADQLKKGIEVEMEHTHDRRLAEEIAKDHLEEDPQYYDKLELIDAH